MRLHSLWRLGLRPHSLVGTKRIIRFEVGGSARQRVYITNNSLGFQLGSSSDVLPGSWVVTTNQWYTIVITFDVSRPTSSRVRAFLNGVGVNRSSSATSVATHTQTSIAGDLDSDIADLAVWTDALTDTEAAAYHYDEIDGIALAGLGVLR